MRWRYDSREGQFNPQIAALLAEAEETVVAGYTLLKNERGADDTGPDLPLHYHAVKLAILTASRFYAARYHATKPRMQRRAYDVMAAVLALDAVGAMRPEMQAMANAVAATEDDVAMRSLASRLVAAVAATARFNSVDSQNTLLARLLAIPRLDPPPLETPQIAPMAADKFILASSQPAPPAVEEKKRRNKIKIYTTIVTQKGDVTHKKY